MDRAFLVLGSSFGFLGVAAGAFGSHALRSRLTPERQATFEVAVRYQLVHALAMFAVVFLRTIGPDTVAESVAGVSFAVGVVVFSGSLYALSLTGVRRWGAIAPIGGVCLLAGWLALILAAATSSFSF
jgi:uncharacterized membrane protein YgdD (TMEM256/DUF423 family)